MFHTSGIVDTIYLFSTQRLDFGLGVGFWCLTPLKEYLSYIDAVVSKLMCLLFNQ